MFGEQQKQSLVFADRVCSVWAGLNKTSSSWEVHIESYCNYRRNRKNTGTMPKWWVRTGKWVPRFIVLHSISYHKRCVLYKLKGRPSTSRKMRTRSIEMVWNRTAVSLVCACALGGGTWSNFSPLLCFSVLQTYITMAYITSVTRK